MKQKIVALIILNKHLKAILGINRIPFILKLLLSTPIYKKRFFNGTEDKGLFKVKKTFLLIGALYYELAKIVDKNKAKEISFNTLLDIAVEFQGKWYLSNKRSWNNLLSEHKYQTKHGLIKYNEHEILVEDSNIYRFNITRCLFYEGFKDMGIPWITEAFCRSDEVVFNKYLPTINFNRGNDENNTLAKGSNRCIFIFENYDIRRDV